MEEQVEFLGLLRGAEVGGGLLIRGRDSFLKEAPRQRGVREGRTFQAEGSVC